MLLVRSQGDEYHDIESDPSATSTEGWRVSTSYSRHSCDLRSSSRPTSCDPRFKSKPTSWSISAHRVVRLERIQEDENDGDGWPTYQPRHSLIETNVSVSSPHFLPSTGDPLCILWDQIEEATAAYTCPAWPPDDSRDEIRSVPNSPTHDLANLSYFNSDDSVVSHVLSSGLSISNSLPLQNDLSQYRRDPRNVILDSVQPEIAPHIVITPPEFDWRDFSTMHENAPPPQQYPEYYLCVPGPGPASLFATTFSNGGVDREVQAMAFVSGSEGSEKGDHELVVNGVQPTRVFNPSLFTAMVLQGVLLLLTLRSYL